ncbi:hypothetical protein C4D02_RS21625 [Vibrio parahaemolyticus]|uniref:hypothetical protein n=1 Tax=Vibrio parahaemolyticus TaxID=670 RepID=UPI001DBBF452|nr:hypothetical protein [Vibrio parahaemolyticus]EGR3150076.1 hypothetical protein [Vibrio parahaemolyticus]EGR3164314.1 hypothetical protein [Vibrio parahaemolyticus]EJG0431702.1 hypothetical protein [Vibrio parahaemolyticus]MCS0115249.1 hypothetical protein [Vibrio parahaemolyticus]
MNKKLLILLSLAPAFESLAGWSTSTDIDPMTSNQTHYARSESVKSMKPMASPYINTKSWVSVGCNTVGSMWVSFGFTHAPNMTDDSTKDGYSSANRRVKWDESTELVYMTQKWGSKFIHISESEKSHIRKLMSSSAVTLDLSSWYGSPNAYFKYSLSGSSRAIENAFNKCGISIKTNACEDIQNELIKFDIVRGTYGRKGEIVSLLERGDINNKESARLHKLNQACISLVETKGN